MMAITSAFFDTVVLVGRPRSMGHGVRLDPMPAAHALDGITAILRPRVEGDRNCRRSLAGYVDEDFEYRQVPRPGTNAGADHEAVVGAGSEHLPQDRAGLIVRLYEALLSRPAAVAHILKRHLDPMVDLLGI